MKCELRATASDCYHEILLYCITTLYIYSNILMPKSVLMYDNFGIRYRSNYISILWLIKPHLDSIDVI